MGKDFTGLAIVGVRQKTLIIVHTVPLRNQWAAEVEKVYGITAGVIGSGRFDVSSPVVIGTLKVCTVVFQIYVENLEPSSWTKCIMSRLQRFRK